jgi:hypothetical protein
MARLNDAKATLSDAEKRAGMLLARLGGPRADQDKSLPPGFLMEIMEDRQAMEEELVAGDAEARHEARAKWEAWGRSRRAAEIEAIQRLFESLPDESGARDAAFKSIRTRLNAWRYIERLIEQIDDRRVM